MLWRVAIGVAVLVLLLGAGLVMWVGPRNLIGYWKYGGQAREGTLRVGDVAPDVTLTSLDGSTSQRLGEWIGQRPVVLVFGSFT